MKWIPIANLGTIYNEKVRSAFTKKEQSTKSQSQFDCFFSKIPQNYKKTLGQECVLLVVSDSFGLLFVDFFKEGIIRMDSSISILSFDLTFATAGALKQTLIVHGNKSGVVDFNFCDSDLREAHHSIAKAHTGSVSCLQFSRLSDGRLKCASGSYDRYINLYKINNFGKKEFDPAKDISLYAKLKYPPLTRHKYRIIQLNFSFHNFDQLLNVCDKHATVQVLSPHADLGHLVRRQAGPQTLQHPRTQRLHLQRCLLAAGPQHGHHRLRRPDRQSLEPARDKEHEAAEQKETEDACQARI